MPDEKTPVSTPTSRNKAVYAKPPSTMVSVVEEQSNDDTMMHILPLGPAFSRDLVTSNLTSTSDLVSTQPALHREDIEKAEQSQDFGQKNLSVVSEEMKNPNLKLEKKSIDQITLNATGSNTVSNTLSNINEIKLKKTTNPSISSLRAMSMQPNNYPTVSSASTTLTKGSTRAEYFAAKLHDAIKNDIKNNNDTVETFVYDTTTTTTPPADQNQESIDNFTKALKDSDKNKLITPVGSELLYTSNGNEQNNDKEKLQNIMVGDDTSTFNRTLEDDFDIKSHFSLGSKKQGRRKASKHSHHPLSNESHPPKREDDKASMNQLRQITSRLFDNKQVQQRRYSSIDNDFANDDSYEDGVDYYEPSFPDNFNYNSNLNPNNFIKSNDHLHNAISHNPFDFVIHPHDVEYGDELSSYFSSNYNSNNNNIAHHQQPNNMNYLNKQPIHGNMLNSQDYGSIGGDKKKMLWKRSKYYNSPHDFTSSRAQRLRQFKNFCYSISLIMFLLFIGFISGFILATNKELQGIKITEVSNTLVSQEELVFDMKLSAFNPGLMPITIDLVQLDIFAKTQYIYLENTKSSYETVLLGSIDRLEIPLYFQGGFLNRKRDTSETQIKILNPCSYDDNDGDDGDDDGKDIDDTKDEYAMDNFDSSNINDIVTNGNIIKSLKKSTIPKHTSDPRWLNISRHPFDLIIRGAMLYKLPLSSQNHTISISYTTYIDPGYDFLNALT
jgi:hypothetical protein